MGTLLHRNRHAWFIVQFMRYWLSVVVVLCLLGVSFDSAAGVIILKGEYQNQNIFVQNAIAGAGVGYCTYEVNINGATTTDEVNSTAFEIDLAQFNLEVGTPITVTIRYKDDGCELRVLNPQALKPNPTFETVSIEIDHNGLLTWTTDNERAPLPFVVEQFKWNKWVKVGEVMGSGEEGENEYGFRAQPHSGLNKFRVRQIGYYDNSRSTPEISMRSMKKEVSFVYNRKRQSIHFSESTGYEVYDKYGTIVKKGFGPSIDLDNLKRDVYYLNHGNTMGEFRKRSSLM